MDLKKKMLEGHIDGVMLRVVRNPAIPMLIRESGLDFFMLDCEQCPYSFTEMHDMFLVAKLAGVYPMVRVPLLNKEWISRTLDVGALGIMVPMMETVDQAKEFVELAKYPPIGNRGYGAGGVKTAYQTPKSSVIEMESSNRQVIAIAQIETRKGVENAQAIAAVDGIDALVIGPNDLSIALGIPGQTMHPEELSAIERVFDSCISMGKGCGLHAGEGMQRKFADKTSFVMIRDDTDILRAGFQTIAKNAMQIKQTPSACEDQLS